MSENCTAWTLMGLLAALVPNPLPAQHTVRVDLLDSLELGWARHWTERELRRGMTQYDVVRVDGRIALRGTANRSASALWRDVSLPAAASGRIVWQWRVGEGLSGNTHEREKRGDDYAARVFLIFDEGRADWNSRSLCYVWAATEPAGSVFRSPYTDRVATVVVESGVARSGQWVAVERDFVADYRQAFGEPPPRLAAVALMVDADDTGARATGYFSELAVEVGALRR